MAAVIDSVLWLLAGHCRGCGTGDWALGAQLAVWPPKCSWGPHSPNTGLGRRRQRWLRVKQSWLWTPGTAHLVVRGWPVLLHVPQSPGAALRAANNNPPLPVMVLRRLHSQGCLTFPSCCSLMLRNCPCLAHCQAPLWCLCLTSGAGLAL